MVSPTKKSPTHIQRLHSLAPGDEVTISNQKNGDWKTGDKVTIQKLSPKNTNVFTVYNANGQITTLSCLDVTGSLDTSSSSKLSGVKKSKAWEWP